MILERLSVHNFGCLGDADFEFDRGLNIIRGPNEAGKSTLQEALLMLLFVKATTTGKDWERLQTWRAPEMYTLSAEFTAADRQWRLSKDFAAKKASLTDVASGDEWTDHDEVQEKLGELLGTGSRDVYESTAAIRQREVATLGASSELGEMLQETISGTARGVSVPGILDKLDRALGDLQRGLERSAPKNPGPLVIIKGKIKDLKGKLEKLRQQGDKVTGARQRLREAEQELEELEPRIEQAEDVLKKADLRRRLEEQREKTEDDWVRLHGRVEEAERLERQIADLGEVAQLEQERRDAEQAVHNLRARSRGRLVQVAAGMGLVLVGLAGAGISSVWWLLLAAVGAALALVGSMSRPAPAVLKLAGRLEEIESRLATQRELWAELRGVLGSQQLGEMRDHLARLALERATTQQQLESPDLAHIDLDTMKIEELRRQLERDTEREKSLQREQIETNIIIRSSEYDVEEELRTQEQLDAAQERQSRLRHKEAVYQLTREVLAEAYHETLGRTTDALEPRVVELLNTITLGRYDAVRVDSDSFAPVVYSVEKGAEAEPDELSCATGEQLYLAARLALTEVLWPDEGPPLLLDDPLVNFDPQRAATTLELLADFAQARQILFFTCSSRFDGYAGRLIQLPAPAGPV